MITHPAVNWHTKIIETFWVLRAKYSGWTSSIQCLLMPQPLASQGHQQSCYWLCRINMSLSLTKKDFNWLCNLGVGKLKKMEMHLRFNQTFRHDKSLVINRLADVWQYITKSTVWRFTCTECSMSPVTGNRYQLKIRELRILSRMVIIIIIIIIKITIMIIIIITFIYIALHYVHSHISKAIHNKTTKSWEKQCI